MGSTPRRRQVAYPVAMTRSSDPDETLAAWRATVAAGDVVVIRQSRTRAVGYLLLVVGLTAVCVWVLLRGDGWWLRTALMWAGVLLFGVLGIPVLARQVVRGEQPVVRVTATTVSVGDETLPLSQITWVRRHDGTYGEVAADRSGGVSVFRGEEHVLEIPLPPSVPTGAVERLLVPGGHPRGE